MSIPRAKIKRAELGFKGYDWTCSGCLGRYIGYDELSETVEETIEHLYSAHGVRTVGSLTADDIGKWVETEGREPLRLDYVSHSADGLSVINDGEYRQLNIDGPSTPCRVTEERP